MKFLKFFYESKLRIFLTTVSTVAFIDTWSSYGFSGTREIGALGIFLYSVTFAYGGAIFGVAIACARMGVQKIMGREAEMSKTLINVVWTFNVVSMLYTFFKYYHF